MIRMLREMVSGFGDKEVVGNFREVSYFGVEKRN